MLTQPSAVLRGSATWKWYWGFLQDPLSCFDRATSQFGPVLGLEAPLPYVMKGRRDVFALGGEWNRHVLGQPDLFRPGGQVMRGHRGSAHQRLRNGLLAMYGDKHRRHRKALAPPFSKSAVGSYLPIMTSQIDQVLGRWKIGEPFDMYAETVTLANWIAAHILFGHEDFEHSMALSRLVTEWIHLDVEARRLALPLNFPGTAYHRLNKHAEVLEAAMIDFLDAKRRQGAGGNDLMSILIRAVDDENLGMSEIDIVAHAVIFHGAAFITTASALAWMMYFLAQYPDVAAAVNSEVEAKLTDWPPTIEQLDSIPLLDHVVRESLRLMPPVHHTIRSPTGPTEIGGIALKKGDYVYLSGFHTHRNPNVFPNPGRFDPWRWASAKPTPYEYIPFSAGPRMCLGYLFAMQEMKLIVARVAQLFRLSVVPGSRIDAACKLTLSPANGLPMMVHRKDGAYAAVPISGNILELVEPA